MMRALLPAAVLLLALVIGPPASPAAGAQDGAAGPPCAACVRIRVGPPHVARGPAADTIDNRLSVIRLSDGRFRGFIAHGETRAVDGRNPADMSGPARLVLGKGPPGSYASCGQWLNHAELAGATVLGLVHDETACNYQAGQTHKSMSLATSVDQGLNWKVLGQVITGTDTPTAGKNTGEGDCTLVNGQDGYYYAYCFRPRDGGLIVARAGVSDPGPGHWFKYFQGRWDQPGLGGDATRLMNGSGVGVARWTTTGDLVLTGWVKGGLGLFLTADHTTLTALAEPLLVLDPGEWKRPAPSELVVYPVLRDAGNGSNQLSNVWLLAYAYWPPGGGHAAEYLVFRDIEVSLAASPVTPQVGVLLARWYSAGLHDRWSTTGPVPGNDTAYKLESRSGYLMTVAESVKPTIALEDCVSDRPGHPDHLLAEPGFCEAHAYQRLRTAGFIYRDQQPGTVPLYRCYNAREQSHFASNMPDCEALGAPEKLLGYALAR
ncbi:MAG: hypothetical protein P4M07_06025 [Xanthobacteraceae bacterium]|nr:hypothetical protein [Xanthobacteraceae bacterium]